MQPLVHPHRVVFTDVQKLDLLGRPISTRMKHRTCSHILYQLLNMLMLMKGPIFMPLIEPIRTKLVQMINATNAPSMQGLVKRI